MYENILISSSNMYVAITMNNLAINQFLLRKKKSILWTKITVYFFFNFWRLRMCHHRPQSECDIRIRWYTRVCERPCDQYAECLFSFLVHALWLRLYIWRVPRPFSYSYVVISFTLTIIHICICNTYTHMRGSKLCQITSYWIDIYHIWVYVYIYISISI